MEYEVVTLPERKITGVGVRTANDAPDCRQKIGGLWQTVQERQQDATEYYGLYTDYQPDGSYLAVVGTEGAVCTPDEVCVTIPAGTYARFHFRGDVHSGIYTAWQEIWNMELSRVYTVDFEEYLCCDATTGQGEAYIYVALGHICQSCGMPMTLPEQYGTEQDGAASQDYCCYCRKDGAFVQDCTMEEMVEFCLQYGPSARIDTDMARKQMMPYFATLKRWRK